MSTDTNLTDDPMLALKEPSADMSQLEIKIDSQHSN